MDGTRRRFKPSRPVTNGHGSPRALLDGRAVGLTGALRAESPDREATRYLSAATQISVKYAESIVDNVVNERLRALAPTFGVDVPVVVKWAIKALRTRTVRDSLLTTILMLQLLLTITVILWWGWAWTPIALLLIAAWVVVSWEYCERMHNTVRGKMLRDRFNPDKAPYPPRQADRDRLGEIVQRRDGNLAVFSGHSAFVGSGDAVYRQRLLLDIRGGKEPDTDKVRKPDPFTSHDLHVALIDAFGRERGLARSLDNIRVYERLFVNGLHVQNNEQLLPDELRAPPTSVDKRLLQAAAVRPSPEARTYVCVEMPGWQGQLVVTLYIRGVYAGDSLYVEYVFRVLPPIRREFLVIDRLYEFSRYDQIKDSLRRGLREVLPALLVSPGHVLASRWRRQMTRHRQSWNAHAIDRGYVFDYGARQSIRELASGSQRQHYFLARDEQMYVLLAQQTLIQAVGTFLVEHGIDMGQFDEQVKVIFNQSVYNVGDIKGSAGVVIGDNSSATVGGGSPKGAG